MNIVKCNDTGEWKCPACSQITFAPICHCGLPGPSLFRDSVCNVIIIRILILHFCLAKDYKKKQHKRRKIQKRPACKYGSNCYRKNPQHKKEYSHPGDSDYPKPYNSSDSSDSEESEENEYDFGDGFLVDDEEGNNDSNDSILYDSGDEDDGDF